MVSKIFRVSKLLTCVVLIAQLAGCGTIMYPERRGQRGGKIDPGVAVMDGIGLLLFVIPGVIAFVIDFSTGTIYLPETPKRTSDIKNIKAIKFDAGNWTNATFEKIVKQETGFDVKINQADIEVTRLMPANDIKVNLAKAFNRDKN